MDQNKVAAPLTEAVANNGNDESGSSGSSRSSSDSGSSDSGNILMQHIIYLCKDNYGALISSYIYTHTHTLGLCKQKLLSFIILYTCIFKLTLTFCRF